MNQKRSMLGMLLIMIFCSQPSSMQSAQVHPAHYYAQPDPEQPIILCCKDLSPHRPEFCDGRAKYALVMVAGVLTAIFVVVYASIWLYLNSPDSHGHFARHT